MVLSVAAHRLLVAAQAEDIIEILRDMCIERERRIEGEWGCGHATDEQPGDEIDNELAQRLRGKNWS